jgi:hypothetical protein
MKCINNLRQSYTNQLIVQIKKYIFMHFLKIPMQRKIHVVTTNNSIKRSINFVYGQKMRNLEERNFLKKDVHNKQRKKKSLKKDIKVALVLLWENLLT